MRFNCVPNSNNSKTGPVTVITSSSNTCPPSCPLKRNGCYAECGPLLLNWRRLDNKQTGGDFEWLLDKLREVSPRIATPIVRLWQAGDCVGLGEAIDFPRMRQLVEVLNERHFIAYGYTHKDPAFGDNAAAIRYCNSNNVVINLSANNLVDADRLADLAIGPVTVVVPSDTTGRIVTPAGRRVVLCPATQKDDVHCCNCGGKSGRPLCARANRKSIIAFPAHGVSVKKVDMIVGRKGN